jgi:hypothetical protein
MFGNCTFEDASFIRGIKLPLLAFDVTSRSEGSEERLDDVTVPFRYLK